MLVDADHTARGVGRLQFNSIREAQIRYMAIDMSVQRRGLGSRLLAEFGQQAAELAQSYGVEQEDMLIYAGGNFRIQFPSKKEACEFGERLANAYRLLLDASMTALQAGYQALGLAQK